jgi:hypothetical protein
MIDQKYKSRIFMSLVFCAGLIIAAPLAARAQDACQYPNLVEWPATNPVWKMCWVAPPNSSGIDGSGLELRSVYYKGKLVINRAHVPVINVKYDPGGCGGPFLSYRDWMVEYQAFEVENVLLHGYAEPSVPPTTVCDHPGFDSGGFEGVAVLKGADHLTLTTQLRTTWYRYIQTWTFYADGTLEPRIAFTAVDHFCTPKPHTHNAYWRFDFDIQDPTNDVVEERNSGTWNILSETQRTKNPSTNRRWRVRDTATNDSLDLIPGLSDNTVDDFGIADFWALGYHDTELDDGGATSGPMGDAAHINNYVNTEGIEDGTHNIVVWYRGGDYHNGDANHCEITGPTIKVKPQPPDAPGNLQATAQSTERIDLAWTDNAGDEEGFRIERSLDGIDFTPLTTTDSDNNSYSDTGLSAGVTYYYRVRAFNSNGDSPNSNLASATTYATVSFVPTAAQAWLGLKNSDDVGTKFDLLAEVFQNGQLIASGQLNNVPGGSSGFNNAVLRTVNLALPMPVGIQTGDIVSIRLSVRIAANSGHQSGTARLWFNDAAANSRFSATTGGVTNNYFLRNGFGLSTVAGTGPKATIDVLVNRNVGGNPFKPFGTWNFTY